ncbi:MAG TPA: alpha/beta fold hydrolase [Chloroflexia bacterium]|nr:alpha/beta fold hydrolase [Chloroflexia bacterium]
MLLEKEKERVNTRKPFFKSRRFWIPLVAFLGVLILVYVGISFYGADTMTRIPPHSTVFTETPAKYGLAYEDVSFPSAASDHLNLSGWWIPLAGSNRALVIVHGHNQSRVEMLYLATQLREMGFNLLYFDYRGHGSTPWPHYSYGQWESWDVVGAFNFVKTKGFEVDNIAISARSYGAVSSLLAMGHSSEIKTVFSDSAWANFSTFADWRFTREYGLPNFFLPGIYTAAYLTQGLKIEEMSPELTIKNLSGRRIFLIHGGQDNDVSYQEFYRLKEAGGANIVGSWFVPNARHCQAYELYPQEYMQKLKAFLNNEPL